MICVHRQHKEAPWAGDSTPSNATAIPVNAETASAIPLDSEGASVAALADATDRNPEYLLPMIGNGTTDSMVDSLQLI
jgi:hypothetical protein